MSKLKILANHIADFFLPSHCFSCEMPVADGKVICEKCYNELERLPDKVCVNCGYDIKSCECNDRVFYFKGMCSAFYNTSVAQKGIYNLKFHNQKANARLFAKEMYETVNKRFEDVSFDLICCIPLRFLQSFKKEYNHSEELAKELSKLMGVPVNSKLLKRKPLSKTQHQTSNFKERHINAQKSFYCKGKIKCKRVLLVDDIRTTAATLNECARLLLYAGAREVYCATALMAKKNLEKGK